MRSQICDCMLTLGGDIQSIQIFKQDITVPEAAVLNMIHGDNAVHKITNIREVNLDAPREKARLSARYLRRAGTEGARDPAEALFPGLSPSFPPSFESLGMVAPVAAVERADADDFATFEPVGGDTGGGDGDDDDDDDAGNPLIEGDVDGATFDAAGNLIPPQSGDASLNPDGTKKSEGGKDKDAAKDSKKDKGLTPEQKLAAAVGA